MRNHQSSLISLCLTCLLGLPAPGCVTIVDDDDGVGDDRGATEGGSNGDADDGADSSGGGGDQQRSVRICEVRVVCEDGSVNEASQALCLTAEETSMQLEFVAEACIEDMTAACEFIGDGTSLECGGECSEAMEPCECDDPSEGCPI